MRVFVTGGSGFIGSAVVPELIRGGHSVLALARSDESAQRLKAAGAEALPGDLEDARALRSGALQTDGVVHLGFVHDFSRFAEVCAIDQGAIETMGEVLEGSNKPLAIASGVLGFAPGRVATERDMPIVDANAMPRLKGAEAALALASRGVRSSVIRLAPSVHGEGDHGFVPMIIDIARKKGVSAYIGDGTNRWPGVHRFDAATLYRLAIEKAPAGSILHGTAEEGVTIRSIAEVIGRHLNVPVVSIAPEQAGEHFGFLGHFLGADAPVSNAITRELLGWNPAHPGLIEDLDAGHYFSTAAA